MDLENNEVVQMYVDIYSYPFVKYVTNLMKNVREETPSNSLIQNIASIAKQNENQINTKKYFLLFHSFRKENQTNKCHI